MWRYIVAIFFVLMGIPFVFLGGKEALREISIRDGITIDAEITETRYSEGNGYEVRYEFRLGDQAYTFADSFGRTNLWATLSGKPEGDTVTVIYLPSDPWRNRPTQPKVDPLADDMAPVVIGVFSIGFGVLLAVTTIIAKRKQKAGKKSKTESIA